MAESIRATNGIIWLWRVNKVRADTSMKVKQINVDIKAASNKMKQIETLQKIRNES